MLEIVIQEVLWWIQRSYLTYWSVPLANVKLYSEARPVRVTINPIRLFANFMALISSLTLAKLRYEKTSTKMYTQFEIGYVSIEHLWRCDMPAGIAYPSRHLVLSLFGTSIYCNSWDHFPIPVVICLTFSLPIYICKYFLDFSEIKKKLNTCIEDLKVNSHHTIALFTE